MAKDDENAILGINLAASFTSLLGSLFIISIFLIFKENRNFAFTLVFCLSMSDIFLSLSNILTLGDFHKPGGNEAMCVIQGFLRNYFGLCSVFWTVIIAVTLYATVVKNVVNITIYQKKFLLLGYAVPLLITLIPLFTSDYGSSGHWCGVKTREDDRGRTLAIRLLVFYVELWVAFAINAFCIYKVIRYANSLGLNNEGKEMFNRLKYYPPILIISWTFGTINRVYQFFGDDVLWLSCLHIFFGGLQGFFNALAYGGTSSIKFLIKEKILSRCMKRKEESFDTMITDPGIDPTMELEGRDKKHTRSDTLGDV